MTLGERKKKILQAIVDDYISTAEPVGSGTIAKKYSLGLSSATIRNEMSDLEDMGYLDKPHTSAGRVPSLVGYRLYVDQLMKQYQMTLNEMEMIKQAMHIRLNELNQMMEQVSRIVSRLTPYTTVVSTPSVKALTVKHIELISIDEAQILMVLVTGAGVVKHRTIYVGKPMTMAELAHFSGILNEKLQGLTLEEINLSTIQSIRGEAMQDDAFVMKLLDEISDCITENEESQVYLGGAAKFFNFPEYHDVQKVRRMLDFLETKQAVQSMLSTVQNKQGILKGNIRVMIGDECGIADISDMSILTSDYLIGNKVVGTIGIIGPCRMDYAKTMSELELLTQTLNHILNKPKHDGEKSG